MLVIWILESQRTTNADEKAGMVMTFKGAGGCTYDKRKNGKINLGVNFGGNLVSKRASGIGVLMCICFLLIVSVHADGHEPERNLTKELEETIAGMREEDGYRVSLLKIYQERTDVLTSEIARLRNVISDIRGESPSDSSSSLVVDVPPVTEEEQKSWYYYFFPKSRTTYFIPVNDTADAKEEKKCETFKCCSLMVVETAMDILWVAVTDPVNLAGKVSESVSKVVKDQLQVLSGILGTAITFTALNMAVYVTTKFSKICSKAKRLCGRMCDLPVPALGIDLFKQVIGWASEQKEKPALERAMEERLEAMTEAMKKIKDELKRVPRAELQQKCSYCGSNVHTIKNCPLRMAEVNKECAYCGKRGHFAYECLVKKQDEEKGVKPWQGMIGSWGNCRYCGRRGHKESECRVKQRDEMLRKGAGPSNWQAQKPPLFPKPPKPPPRNVNTVDNRENFDEKKRSVYAPIHLDGVKFSRCLIDTGSQVNLIPKADVTRNQFVVSKNEIQEIYGFNGTPGQILGTVSGDLKLGPNKEPKKAVFMVSSEITTPIIGFPTLRDFGLSINCQKHEIVNEQTGESVFCSVVMDEKN